MRYKTKLPASILLLIVLAYSCGTSKNEIAASSTPKVKVDTIPQMPTEPVLDPIQVKYGELLGVTPKEITNLKLYKFADEWMNTPYKLGGENKKGIDCSALAQHLYVDIYDYLLERTSAKMANAPSTDKFIGQEFLEEGDILFFKKPNSKDETVTHVGVYLKNDKFISASGYDGPENFRGVKISDLNHEWWQERFLFAGRKPLKIYQVEKK